MHKHTFLQNLKQKQKSVLFQIQKKDKCSVEKDTMSLINCGSRSDIVVVCISGSSGPKQQHVKTKRTDVDCFTCQTLLSVLGQNKMPRAPDSVPRGNVWELTSIIIHLDTSW